MEREVTSRTLTSRTLTRLRRTTRDFGVREYQEYFKYSAWVHSDDEGTYEPSIGGAWIPSNTYSSEERAKHNGSRAVSNRMIGHSSYREVAAPTTTVDGAADNPVGELQELTQRRLLSPPQYEITGVRGPPHDREFLCYVKLGRITKRGTGKSKKQAKYNAAMKMLQAVDVTSLSQEYLDSPGEEEDDDALMDSSKSAYADLKKGKKIPTLTPFVSRKISSFYTHLKNASGKKLNRLHTTSLNTPASNFCQLLQEIAEEQCFEVTYVDLQELSYKGHRQCLVQLSTMPVAVCHGSGPTSDECHVNAAHNALQYLKIMTKKA